MAVEARRGCGFRKVGGLYLVGSGGGHGCDRLPIPLVVCPCCGQGIKQTRGWTWVDVAALTGGDHQACLNAAVAGTELRPGSCHCPQFCPLCWNVQGMGKAGLVWIGTQFYATIEAFEAEAKTLGVSRRIAALPRGFELGKSWVLFAHPRGIIQAKGDLAAGYVPAIFRVWKPERIERIYDESQRGSDEVAADEKRGITPIFVPDADKDHHGSVYSKDEPDAPESTETTPGLF